MPDGNGELTQEEIRELRPSLKELVDIRFKAIEKSVDLRFAALEKAVEVAKTTNDFRLDAMNEFRASMSDQSDRFLTKAEHQSWKDNVNSDLRIFRGYGNHPDCLRRIGAICGSRPPSRSASHVRRIIMSILLTVFVYVLVFCLLYWLISLLPLPPAPPWIRTVLYVFLILVAIIVLLVFAFPVFASTGRDATGTVPDLSPEFLAGLGGGLLTLAFSYIPRLRTWYGGKDDVSKSLIMAAGIGIVAVLILLSSCFNLWIIIQCVKPGILDFLKLVGIALVVNQSTYKISPQLADVKAVKADRP